MRDEKVVFVPYKIMESSIRMISHGVFVWVGRNGTRVHTGSHGFVGGWFYG